MRPRTPKTDVDGRAYVLDSAASANTAREGWGTMYATSIETVSRPWHETEQDHRWRPKPRREWNETTGRSQVRSPVETVWVCTCGEVRLVDPRPATRRHEWTALQVEPGIWQTCEDRAYECCDSLLPEQHFALFGYGEKESK